MTMAHMWALKHWYFQQREVGLEEYIHQQVRTVVMNNLSESARKRVGTSAVR